MNNTARAAAAASTPNIKGGVYMDSFDARIIEYQYAIGKLSPLITHIKAIFIKVRSSDTLIPLIHYLETIIGPLLSINETLSKRLDSIARLIPLVDQRKVIPPLNTFAVNFELDDTDKPKSQYITDADIPYKILLENILSVLENALVIYQTKLKHSMVERDANRIPGMNHQPVPLDLSILKDIMEPTEVLSLFKFVIEKDKLDSFTWIKAQTFVETIEKSTLDLKKHIDKLRDYKAKPVDGTLKKLPHWQYAIHRIFTLVVRLSDLYTIVRKFGRELYLPSFNELHNPKILHHNIRLEVALKHADEYFKQNKKNQQLAFILVKGTHQGSYFHLKHATVLEFTTSALAGYDVLLKTIEVLLTLIKSWETARKERPLRPTVNTSSTLDPKSNDGMKSPETRRLEVLFNPEKDKHSQEVIAKQQREREKIFLEERASKERMIKERQFIDDLNNRRKVEERERQLRDGLRSSPDVSRSGSLRNSTPIVNRSRSGSNASVSSNSSNSSTLNSMKSNSLTSASRNRTSPTISRSPSIQRRPVSVYMSSPAFDIRSELRRQEKARVAAASAAASSSISNSPSQPSTPQQQAVTRRRSSSLQSSTSPAERNSSLIAAAASAALKTQRTSSLQSKTEVNKYRHALQRREEQLLDGGEDSIVPRSPSPLRSHELPDISELVLGDDGALELTTPTKSNNKLRVSPDPALMELPPSPKSILKPRKFRTPSASSSPPKTKPATIEQSPSVANGNHVTIPEEPNKIAATPIPLKEERTIPLSEASSSTSEITTKPVLKIVPPTSSLEPPAITPELVNETTSESSISTNGETDNVDAYAHSPKSLDTIQQPEPLESPQPIIKKVRFTGVPEEIEEDRKPKRKGWIKPPRLVATAFGAKAPGNKSRTSLSVAADALQQERIAFHNIKRGEVIAGPQALAPNQRITATLGANPNKGKWKSLRDKFA